MYQHLSPNALPTPLTLIIFPQDSLSCYPQQQRIRVEKIAQLGAFQRQIIKPAAEAGRQALRKRGKAENRTEEI